MMDKNSKIIIGLLCIIVLLLVVGLFLIAPFSLNEPTELSLVSSQNLYYGDELVIAIVDSNKNPISNGTVNIQLKSSNGNNYNYSLNVENGEVKLPVDNLEPGDYKLSCQFEGSDNYSKSNLEVDISIQIVNYDEVEWTSNGACTYRGKFYSPGEASHLEQSMLGKEKASNSNNLGEKRWFLRGYMYWDPTGDSDGRFVPASEFKYKYGYVPA